MQSTSMILLLDEVAARLGLAPATVRKYLAQRRQGIGSLPLPISQRGGKLRWLTSDIEAYLQSLSNNEPPVKVASASKRRQESKSFKQRQEAAQKALERHRSDFAAKTRQPVKKYKLPEPLPYQSADK